MKRWNYGQCRALTTCDRNVAGGVDLRLRDGWPQVVSCAQKASIGHIQTGGGATAEDNDKLAACSNNDQASVFAEGMLNAASAGDENAVRVDISIGNGHTLVLYGKVYPHDAMVPNDLGPA
ncbi:hypothetical protein B0T18DRAFT_392665 [Schizothecium vesticola]|uniref:Uncharacterized protein n=1 Tax=Schizothecium vesticola TaxID=314040 RepID=A0AA40ER45_9PEZI|nr:hypothetical protein B0T18DRAFT_392665 [Schizothecium vesticola]